MVGWESSLNTVVRACLGANCWTASTRNYLSIGKLGNGNRVSGHHIISFDAGSLIKRKITCIYNQIMHFV